MSNRKQHISFNNTTTNQLEIKCDDTDDTNLFYSNNNIQDLFATMNEELKHITKWFNANKLSLNTGKTKYTFFHKSKKRYDIPLRLPLLKINGYVIERQSSIKFLGVLLDETLSWKDHISIIETKIAKNIGLLYKAKNFVNEECLKQLYFAYIHSYLSYANIAWASTHKSKLKKLISQQKQACRIIFREPRLAHAQPLLKTLRALNLFQINIYQTVLLMHKVENNDAPAIFNDKFRRPNHQYPTTFSQSNNFIVPRKKLRSSDFTISSRGPQLWNHYVSKSEKSIKSFALFKKKIKASILNIEKCSSYFL